MRARPASQWTFTAIVTSSAFVLTSCGDSHAPPAPSFDALFPPLTGDLMTNSSPVLADLNGDGALDIVFGAGVDRLRPGPDGYTFSDEPEIPGHVIAVSGAGNEILWTAPNPGEAFTTARFIDVNDDGVLDVIIGGREGAFTALGGTDGTTLWRVDPDDVAKTPVPYNFFSPAFIEDVNGDGVNELVVVYGGDDTKLPGDTRDPGHLAVISGSDGAILSVHETPDGSESYSSVVVYHRPDGNEWLIFGTGGETHGGAAYRAPVGSLMDGSFRTRLERLVPAGEKGVMAPATLVELTGDDEPDVVISTFDGRLIAVDGATRESLWHHSAEGEEAYHPAAVTRIAADGRLGLALSRGMGVFPRYVGTVHRLYDAADGELLYEYRDPQHPAGAPLAVDLTGDGIDEPFFFSMRYPTAHGGRIHVLDVSTRQLITHDVTGNMASTPLIADPRRTGTLELIALSWHIGRGAGSPDWRNVSWELMRLDLGAPTPPFMAWTGYMGTTANGRFEGAERN